MTEVQAELQRFHKDTQYYEAHREELLEQYPEQWVATYDEQVAGAAPEFERLLDNLQAMGVPIGQVFIEYLTRKDELLVLHS